MALTKQFEEGLDELFLRRTAWLRNAIGKKHPGPAPKFTRAQVGWRLSELEDLVKSILLRKRGKREFRSSVEYCRRWHPKRGKGWGVDAKKASFKAWYDCRVDHSNCVYVFWSDDRCEYVGRTINGRGRPQAHFDKFWFRSVTQIDVYAIERRSEVAKAECLAIDLFDPRRNDYAASRPMYSKKCPICSATREIRNELRSLFRLR